MSQSLHPKHFLFGGRIKMAEGNVKKLYSIFNKSQTNNDTKAKEKQFDRKRKYESETRKRIFQVSWLSEFAWLVYENIGDDENSEKRMFCSICRNYDKIGSFVTGTDSFRKDALKAHDMSIGHQKNAQCEKAKNDPENTEGWLKTVFIDI